MWDAMPGGHAEGIGLHRIIEEDVARVCGENRELLGALDGQGVLVSGGAGFLGAYFIDLLSYWNEHYAEKPCRICCLDTFITGTPRRLEHLEGKPYFAKLGQNVTEAIPAGVDAKYILHFASIASPTFYRLHPLETIEANVLGTKNLLDYAAAGGAKSMLFMSTSEIYGDPPAERIPTSEDYRGNVSCTGPRACYDESKRLGETLCVNYKNVKSVPVKIARPFNVYGPGLRLDDRRVLPDMFSGAYKNREIVLHSDGSPTRSFCYASDALDGFVKILMSGFDGQPFNVGNDLEEISMEKLARTINSVFGGGITISYKKSQDNNYLTDNPQRRCPDLAKIKKLVGYSPKIMLREGVSRLKQWYDEERVA